MDKINLTRLVIAIILVLAVPVYFFIRNFKKDKLITTKFITRTAIFSAIATILYIVPYVKFPLFFFPSFLEIHFDEIPALIAGFAYGPLSGFFVILVKTLIKLPLTSTLGVGELADLIYGLALVIPSSLIYKKRRNIKGAFVGLGVASLIQLIISSFLTTFVMLDFYIYVMGFSKEMLLNMCQIANPNVSSLTWPFFFWVALPFNLLKDVLLCLLTALLYKRLHKLIDRI
jgi:riboflavin transporter FmnP